MPNITAKERNTAAVRRLFARHSVSSSSTTSWVTPSVRCAKGILPPEIHRRNQWRLAGEMGYLPFDKNDASCSDEISHDEALVSCYSLGRRIARHAWGGRAEGNEKEKLQGGEGVRAHVNKKELRAVKEHQKAIIRYELSIPRRRAVGHFSHLTGAQLDLCKSIPSGHTADRIVEHTGGRWVLQNSYRQQLLHGEPIMTRVMRGEFCEYHPNKIKNTNFHEANKRHIRIASHINSTMRTHVNKVE